MEEFLVNLFSNTKLHLDDDSLLKISFIFLVMTAALIMVIKDSLQDLFASFVIVTDRYFTKDNSPFLRFIHNKKGVLNP